MRHHWTLGDQRRYDPRILSVCKQLYEEASEILYHKNFIIDVNCGDFEYSEYELQGTDWRWRSTNLTGRFPFHKVHQLTLRLDIDISQDPSHLFYHMVYLCGLLLSEAKYMRHLYIEIVNNHAYNNNLDGSCPLWKIAGSTGSAEQFSVQQSECSIHREFDSDSSPSLEPQNTMIDHINFLLKPLALPGRVQKCHIDISDIVPMTPNLKASLLRYEDALMDKRPFGYEVSKKLWEYYLFILDRQADIERMRQRHAAAKHEQWLVNTHLHHKCKHPSRSAKKYSRFCGKDTQCDGCNKWHHFVMECRKCQVRACTSCMSNLRKKITPIQRVKLHDAWLVSTSQLHSYEHPLKATKKYRRPYGKSAKCEGCEKEFSWLVQCRKCKLRACVSCTSEIRKKQAALQEDARSQGTAYWSDSN